MFYIVWIVSAFIGVALGVKLVTRLDKREEKEQA